MIIDAHLHLWKKQQGMVNGKKVYGIGGGRSDFGGEIRQMMPAYMTDGENSLETQVLMGTALAIFVGLILCVTFDVSYL